jgi:hypothetical protein
MLKTWSIGVFFAVAVVGSGFWWFWHSSSPSAQPSRPQGGFVSMSEGLPQGQQWRQDFAFADMDGDGMLDLVTAPPRKSKEPWPHIFLYRQERWQPACRDAVRGGFPLQQYNYGGIAVADFDGDQSPEIAIAMHAIGIRIFKNSHGGPCGPWEEQQNLPSLMTTMPTRAIVAADMNRDGRIDLVALSEAPMMGAPRRTVGIVIFWNEAAGWQSQALLDSKGLFGDDVAVGEVNGDGIPDLAVGSLSDQRPQFVWLSSGEKTWKPATAEGLPEYIVAWSVQLVDLDNDRRDELVLGVGGAPVRKTSGPRVYKWAGTRWVSLSQGLPQESWVCGVTVVDVDGDGRKELIAAGMYIGTVRVYGQQADGTWVERHSFSLTDADGLGNYKVRAAVVDRDKGRPLVVANYAGENKGKIEVWVWQ